MLFVLADDFSGAAEIGGIGHRYGLRTEIQLRLDTRSTADLVVLDTDTRALSENDATKRIFDIATALKKLEEPVRLFKKIDSVMRGHLIPELNVMQDCFNFRRIFLMPANPGRGRKIIKGEYFISGVSLRDTVFATDPDFPANSSHIAERIGSYTSTLPHVHVTASAAFPSSSIITGDIESKVDLKKYVAGTDENDLCCGAAELFESYLEHLGFSIQAENSPDAELANAEFTLIINGSTVKNQDEYEWYRRLNIAQLSLPGNFNGVEYQWSDESAMEWFRKVLNSLHTRKVAVVTIDHPVQHNKILSQKFLRYFVELMDYIIRHVPLNRIHL